MVQITGKYHHEKNENLDEYYTALGVPLVPRKMMCFSSPSIIIAEEEDVWTMKTETLLRTTVATFKLGEEYEEKMPSGDILKNVTTQDGETLTTVSTNSKGVVVDRIYNFTEEGMVLTLKCKEPEVEAKRYFKRLAE